MDNDAYQEYYNRLIEIVSECVFEWKNVPYADDPRYIGLSTHQRAIRILNELDKTKPHE